MSYTGLLLFVVGLSLYRTRATLQNLHIDVEVKYKPKATTNTSSSTKPGIFDAFLQILPGGINDANSSSSNIMENRTVSTPDITGSSSSSGAESSKDQSNGSGSVSTPSSSTETRSKDHRPSGLRLVLMGDSLTRYQYVSLAYFLRHGHWFNESKVDPHLVNEHSYGSFEKFFEATTAELSPYERCDCYRPNKPIRSIFHVVTENRYFWEPTHDNAVAFITLFGSNRRYHGSFSPEDAFHDIDKYKFNHSLFRPEQLIWKMSEWHEVVEKHVAQLDPKMTHVVMNAGAWKNDFASSQVAREQLTESVHQANMTSIWKTTTRGIWPPYNQQPYRGTEVSDPLMCGLADDCFNLSWTRDIYSNYSWEGRHYYEPIYRIFNEELMEMIGHPWPEDYQKLDRNRYINESTPHYY